MESAQLRLERMLPELRDLEQKKLFTKSEISAIVAQRQKHEAAISRPRSPEPYLQYIDYERKLERLRRLRVAKLVGQNSKSKARTTISDYSIPLHILNLFSSAAKRFPESRALWMGYITYSLTQSSTKLISRVLSAAIAAHPSQPDFWVMAAQFEADGDQDGKGGGNVDGSRKLLMRGLRFLKGEDSLPLWTEWIRIELSFIQAMSERQVALGISHGRRSMITEANDLADMDAAAQTTMQLDQLRDEVDEINEVSHDVMMTEGQGHSALQSGALVKVVLSNAFKSVQSLSIFNAAISLLNAIDLPIKSALLDFTYEAIQTLHADVPRARVMIITRNLFSQSQSDGGFSVSGIELVNTLASTIKKLQYVCKELANVGMWEEFLSFLIDIHPKLTDVDLREYVSLTIKKTISSIGSKKMDSVRCHELALSHHSSNSSASETLRAAAMASARFPQSVSLCTCRLELLLKTLNTEENKPNLLQTFRQAQIQLPGSLRVAELFVQMVQQKHSQKEMSDTELREVLELSLDHAAKNTRESILESELMSPDQARSVIETYQRALVKCPTTNHNSRKFVYLQLARQSTLSLSFLNWATSYEKDLIALEHLHMLSISHPRTGTDEWTSYLNFLIMIKKDVRQADVQLDKAKRLLGHKLGQVLEERWMELMSRS